MAIAIGIISYKAVHELGRLTSSIAKSTTMPYEVVVYDNTDTPDNAERWFRGNPPLCTVQVLSDGVNRGCTVARNRIVEYFMSRYPNPEYLVILDQDMEVFPGWLEAAMAVMTGHPDAGTVIWPLANLAKRPADSLGRITECGGGACVHRMEAIKAVGGWEERFFFYRFDSWFSIRCASLGWWTYMINEPMEKGHLVIKSATMWHHHPHAGVLRHPRCDAIRVESAKIYWELIKQYGLEHMDIHKDRVE